MLNLAEAYFSVAPNQRSRQSIRASLPIHCISPSQPRSGFGANAINRLTEEKIRRQHNLASVEFYSGQPLLVLENNYDLGLFNGDLGIVWPDESGELFAWFNESEGAYLKIRTSWLPGIRPPIA